MLLPSVVMDEWQESHGYLQDDVFRGLRTSLVSVLSAALADGRASSGYLAGILALARSQAALYGISWCDLVASLRETPKVWNLVLLLQNGCQGL